QQLHGADVVTTSLDPLPTRRLDAKVIDGVADGVLIVPGGAQPAQQRTVQVRVGLGGVLLLADQAPERRAQCPCDLVGVVAASGDVGAAAQRGIAPVVDRG